MLTNFEHFITPPPPTAIVYGTPTTITPFTICTSLPMPNASYLTLFRGKARIFHRGITMCQSEGTHQIVMSFSPPVVGCLLKKGLQKEGTWEVFAPWAP